MNPFWRTFIIFLTLIQYILPNVILCEAKKNVNENFKSHLDELSFKSNYKDQKRLNEIEDCSNIFDINIKVLPYHESVISSYQRHAVSGTQSLYVLRFQDGHVFTSEDEEEFSHLTTPELLPGINETVANIVAVIIYRNIEGARIHLISSPLDNQNQKMWVSDDLGKTFHPVEDFPKPLVSFARNSNNMIFGEKYYNSYSCSLYISDDLGETWRLVMDRSIQCGTVSWSPYGPKTGIYATAAFTLTGLIMPYWNYKLIYSNNFFETYDTIADRISDWSFDANIIVLKRLTTTENSLYTLHVNSEDNIYDFKRMNFTSVSSARILQLFDSRYTSCIMAEAEYNNGSRGVFRSFHLKDPFELLFSTDKYVSINIEPIQALHGGYLMNYAEETDNITRSYFSHDFGDTWNQISFDPSSDLPEEVDEDTYDINDFTVTLELDQKLIYSRNIPGAIIGYGYIHLKDKKPEGNLHRLISTDGGKNWFHLRDVEDVHVHITDNGLLLMLGKNSNLMKYSLNNGNKWESCRLFDPEYNVTISKVTSSLVDRDAVLLFARRSIKQDDEDSFTYENSLIHIKGMNLRLCEDEEYDFWSPHDEDQCANGKKILYKQRLPDSECVYKFNIRSSIQEVLCKCTERDYKCQDPYHYDVNEKKCVYYQNVQNLELLGRKYENCSIIETIPNAFVKKFGNLCDDTSLDNIPELEGVTYKCDEIITFPLESSHNNYLLLNMKWSILVTFFVSIIVFCM